MEGLGGNASVLGRVLGVMLVYCGGSGEGLGANASVLGRVLGSLGQYRNTEEGLRILAGVQGKILEVMLVHWECLKDN